MEGSYRDRYVFVGEWYDNQASLIRRYNVIYYPIDDTIEMYDLKTRKTFVRRAKVHGVQLDNFYIGCTIPILGRLIKIVDFACEDTRKRLQQDIQRTFALIKPIPLKIVGAILNQFHESGLRVSRMKKTTLTSEDANMICRELAGHPSYPFILDYVSGHDVYGIELIGKNAVATCLEVVGDNDPLQAAPGTIRALYGTDPVHNCVQISSSEQNAVQDIEYFFPSPALNTSRLRLTATLSNCTLCIVKPHAVRDGLLGSILSTIDEAGFNVTALNMLLVENVNAGEFFEVYKGIVPEFKGMVEQLASGQCVAMEVVAKDSNVNTAVEFRKLVGPTDPEIARLLRPHTLRAKFGKTKVQNAIHCSDLAEDGLLEVEYFFKILEL